jgi:hypothetical protein
MVVEAVLFEPVSLEHGWVGQRNREMSEKFSQKQAFGELMTAGHWN